MKSIDGIHRAFIVVAVIWSLLASFICMASCYPFDGVGHAIMVIVGLWILPIGLMYSIVWVINGFRKEKIVSVNRNKKMKKNFPMGQITIIFCICLFIFMMLLSRKYYISGVFVFIAYISYHIYWQLSWQNKG